MSWLFFALSAPFLWSFTNFLDKFLVEKKLRNVYVLMFLTGVFYGVTGLLVLLFTGNQSLPLGLSFVALLSGAFFLYLIPYFRALQLEDTSRILPLFEFTNIFVLVIAYVFLRETLTGLQLLGFPLIVLGAFILGTKRLESGLFTPRKALFLMILSSFLFGMMGLLFRVVVKSGHFWTAFSYQGIGAGLACLSLLILPKFRKVFYRDLLVLKTDFWIIFTVNNILNVLGFLSVNYATFLAPVALVTVVTGVQHFFVLIEGLFLSLFFPKIIKEDIDRSTLATKAISIILIFVGIYLINR